MCVVCAGHAAQYNNSRAHLSQNRDIQGDLSWIEATLEVPSQSRKWSNVAFCGSPWIFDLDISIPANMAPGVKTFAVAAVYRDGSRVETTASIEIRWSSQSTHRLCEAPLTRSRHHIAQSRV